MLLAVPSPSLKLTEAELDKAFAILKANGLSDLFPRPFEIDALELSWADVRTALLRAELLSYQPRPTQRIIAPKQRYTIRETALLDPVDYILLTGLVLRFAPLLHAKRHDLLQAGAVHSARLDPSIPDNFSRQSADWQSYQFDIHLKAVAANYVARTDIVDFFPRIYHHRLENAIADISVDQCLTVSIMRMLAAWSQGTSYGIPVGPVCCYVLAEALLYEVDQFLLSNGVVFARYVDDYVIFGSSESDCTKGLFLLGSRLNQTQGLSLNTAKTRVQRSERFLSDVDLEENPDAAIRRTIVQEVFADNPYMIVAYEDLSDHQKELLEDVDVVEILKTALGEEDGLTDFTSLRFVLHILSTTRRRDLVEPLLDSLPRLFPVSHAVGRYFNVLDDLNVAERQRIADTIVYFLLSGAYIPDFQVIWLLEPFAQAARWNHLNALRQIAREHKSSLVRRQATLALGQIGDRSALLDVKVQVDDAQPWEQRAIIYACRALPADEKKAFFTNTLRRVGGEWRVETALTRAVIELSRR